MPLRARVRGGVVMLWLGWRWSRQGEAGLEVQVLAVPAGGLLKGLR